LFTIPYVIVLQAVKVGDDFMCVYNVGMFEFKNDSGYLERATICHFVNSLFRSLGSVELGFVPEEDLENGEEIEGVNACYAFLDSKRRMIGFRLSLTNAFIFLLRAMTVANGGLVL